MSLLAGPGRSASSFSFLRPYLSLILNSSQKIINRTFSYTFKPVNIGKLIPWPSRSTTRKRARHPMSMLSESSETILSRFLAGITMTRIDERAPEETSGHTQRFRWPNASSMVNVTRLSIRTFPTLIARWHVMDAIALQKAPILRRCTPSAAPNYNTDRLRLTLYLYSGGRVINRQLLSPYPNLIRRSKLESHWRKLRGPVIG